MIHLLDVNLLIALIDVNHLHHWRAHLWIAGLKEPFEWASCPLTENAFVRITGHSSYPGCPGSAAGSRALLKKNCGGTNHHFWPDDLSINDDHWWNGPRFPTSSQLTDCYLLALAIKHGGKLASFDQRIEARLVCGGSEALVLLPV